MSDIDSEQLPDSIAIIGMSGRFPGAPDLETFWSNLCDGVESITFFSDDELEDSGWNTDQADLPDLIKAAAVLDGVELFDAPFFGCTPREAQFMDPQHRVFLECAWETLEHAGYDAEQYKGWIGMYGGAALNGYLLYNLYGRPDIMDPVNVLQVTTANERDYLTTRVSYKLNLTGPSVSMQTACSTSLVAIHLACQGLLSYQCDLALAGGVAIRLPQKGGYWYQEGGITSPDGHCRAFDARAQGTVFGSGVGVVLLKRLSEALADGDHIEAVIKGSAINNDGSLKAGFTAPSVDGQRAVIAMAQGVAGVDPETISYIEAHGTGTSIGDPIEVAALTQVFRTKTQKRGFCAIGSVKTNIGHASAAAGIAGLTKTILALKHGQIPPSLHFEQPNPKINFDDSPFYVNTTLAEWKSNGTPRRAGVSSFGVGGTNAHLVIEEAPPVEPSESLRPWHLLALSARTPSALDAATARLADYIERHPDLSLADAAYTLQVGRRSFNHRRVAVCRDRDDALAALRDPGRMSTLAREQRALPIAFMFSGQGAQYVGMARELYDSEPVFREQIDRCARLLAPHLGVDLRALLYPTPAGGSSAASQLDQAARDRTQAAAGLSSAASQLDQTARDLTQAAPGLSLAASQLDQTARDLTQAAPGLSSAASQLDQTAPDLTQAAPGLSSAASQLDQAARDLTQAADGGSPAAGDERRTADDEGGAIGDTPLPSLANDGRGPAGAQANDDGAAIGAGKPSSFVHAPSSEPGVDLNQTQYAQPALFAVEYALAQLWMAWGVHPAALIGHSVGEYVAACLAGVFSLDDALALVALRGRLMQDLPPGAMLSVALPERDLSPLLDERLALAAVNGPARCVVAGPFDAVDALADRLAAQGVDCRRLHVSHAFHSAMMDPILEPFVARLRSIPLSAPSIPFISNVTGDWISDAQATDPRYWAQHLRSTVRFADGVRALLAEPGRVLLEVGPGQTLAALARQHPDKALSQAVIASLPGPQDPRSSAECALHALGQLWLAGAPIDWARRYVHERRLRVPLPTYPFERQRYWIDPPDKSAAATRPGSLRPKADIADWFYIPSWKRSLPPDGPARAADDQEATWLLFCDEHGLGERLARRLAQDGRAVVTARPGAQFGRVDERGYTLRPGERADYEALFKDLDADGALPRRIVHLWNVAPADQPPRAGDDDLSFYSLLALVQAVGSLPGSFEIGVVSNNMQHVAGEARICPSRALLLGPCKVAPQEYPNIACRSVDVVLPASEARSERLLDQLVAELSAPSGDVVVAYRDRDRWVQTYEAVRLPEALDGAARLRQSGVYLITGGLGGIGLAFAERLARTARAKLVLVGRSAFPERAEWDAWLADHPSSDGVSRKIRALRRIEDLGAEILILSADAADEAQMRDVVARARRRFGGLHGVIHSAGIAGGGMIPLKTRAMAARVLAPKVDALRALDAALADAELDFLLLCSSTISVIGGIGQVDYCAANAFLDAFAHDYAARRGTFAVSVNWDAWQDVGMAVDTAAEYDQRGAELASAARPIDHPLLDACIPSAREQVYTARLSPAADWVLDEHRILEVPTLPGTAYLEMARAAFADYAGQDQVELRDVLFLTPLMIPQDEARDLRVIVADAGDGSEFHILSKIPSEGGAAGWQEHVRGKLARMADAERRHDIGALIARCDSRTIAVTPQDVVDLEKFVYWGPRWRTIRTIHVGENERIALLDLPDEFADDIGRLWLHPAMLDVATVYGSWLIGDGHNYLPLSYGKLAVAAPFTQRIYSHVTFRDLDAANKEILSFDLLIADEQGRELARIEEFVLRRVTDAIRSRMQVAGSSEAAGPAAPGVELPAVASAPERPATLAASVSGISSRAGVEVFDRILAHGGFAQVVVATRDLHALIDQIAAMTTARVLERLDEAQSDRAMLPRPSVQSEYAAPRNEVEQRLADIWQSVLGIERVGIHDNFFELGGDSVLSIQIIAKSNSAGVPITPAVLFQRQTIAELAALAESVAPAPLVPSAEAIPLTPLQRWRAEQMLAEAGRGSEAYLIEAHEALDTATLARALRQVAGDHAALRLRFSHDSQGWRQRALAREPHRLYSYADLSVAPDRLIRAVAAGLADGIDPETGPIVRMAQIAEGVRGPARLLLAVHSLAVDGSSWPLLLDELQAAYRRHARGEDLGRAAPTDSFAAWAARLAAPAEADPRELEYWLAPARLRAAPALPVERPDPPDAGVDALVAEPLDADETARLLDLAATTYRADAEDLALTALALALRPWAGSPLLIDVERRGAPPAGEIDLAHTIGCGAARFPLLLDLGRSADSLGALRAVKEQLHSVPNGGAGYGALRYLSGDPGRAERLGALPQAELAFVWQGRSSGGWSLRALPDSSRAGRYRLEVSAGVIAGRMCFDWRYDPAHYRRATIQQLARRCLDAARALLVPARADEISSLTPSDFPEAGLSQAALDKFLESMKQRPR